MLIPYWRLYNVICLNCGKFTFWTWSCICQPSSALVTVSILNSGSGKQATKATKQSRSWLSDIITVQHYWLRLPCFEQHLTETVKGSRFGLIWLAFDTVVTSRVWPQQSCHWYCTIFPCQNNLGESSRKIWFFFCSQNIWRSKYFLFLLIDIKRIYISVYIILST